MSSNSVDPIGSFLKENNPQFFKESKKYPLIIKFSANWCPPCRQLQEEINKFLQLPENKDLLFLEIDVEKHSSLAQKLNIMSIPTTFLFFQEKVIKDPQVGKMDLSQLREFVKTN
ncbi:thioredoxin family protein [endosymbiont GvMRE of Glomus versiforme]|uniref:thioredoxin family protein n=1 Tax=endosymbiont GvMRE of Glomus versiforme TaxID=2039283 RepID=UPI000ECAE966|nr:thioredoxin family protein [endosymbiont GvMRE of Glomus versiforme]RHZ37776.1 Thioredoxin [endosymbiont GvMRE of Glomus versiforme]